MSGFDVWTGRRTALLILGLVGVATFAPAAASSRVGAGPEAIAEPDAPGAAGAVEIRSGMNHKCLEILGLHHENGAHAGMWDCWGGANQQWYWDGAQIRSRMNNKCLDVLAFNNDNGARVGVWDCWGGANQQWYLDGAQLRSRLNNKCLDVLAFNNDNGAEVGMWDCWGGANQQWYVR